MRPVLRGIRPVFKRCEEFKVLRKSEGRGARGAVEAAVLMGTGCAVAAARTRSWALRIGARRKAAEGPTKRRI